MAMGENPDAEASAQGIPTVRSALERKIGSLLPEVGGTLLREAPASSLGGAESLADAAVTVRMAPCGFYAADIELPEDFVRLVGLRVAGWKRTVSEVVGAGDALYACRWSAEPGIAGSAERPKAYLRASASGYVLTAIGGESAEMTVEQLLLWRQPKADPDGNFRFPEALYPALVRFLLQKIEK